MYFKWLFEENNLNNIVLKLNWQAEIFRREASLKEKEVNRAKENKEKSHNIIENARYTKDKLFFHCPIKLNFAKHNEKINQEILKYISDNKEINIIWIDRWEKHLAYYSVINRDWNIIKDKNWNLVKWSLNIVWNNQNYHDKLETREKERQDARWSWKTIWNIKDLKQGYISQVVHKLAELVIEHNAIIVFEDLNSWFKRWRQKIERQVYQKLEKALIEKLNYLTFKDKNFWENWHYLKAYQLTAPFETFEKVWKQTWVIFYTDPSYTSSTCPACWFRKDLYLKYSNLKNALWDIEKIDSIIFDWKRFIFEYNNKKVFTDRDRKRNISSEESWIKWWKTIDNNITEFLEILFKKSNIDYTSWNNLILDIQEINEKELYKWVFDNFNAILNIRNSTIKDNSRTWDFICCPACDFDSRKENKIWIENWDDNWAFNIARKWIIILNKIDSYLNEKWSLDKILWWDMIVKQIDWDDFTHKK
jgi:CRISPR-associated protein Cpf1